MLFRIISYNQNIKNCPENFSSWFPEEQIIEETILVLQEKFPQQKFKKETKNNGNGEKN